MVTNLVNQSRNFIVANDDNYALAAEETVLVSSDQSRACASGEVNGLGESLR